MDKKQIDELLTCAICLDRFKQPKQLPCQHTFCLRPCLQGLLENQRICCPECRAVHGLPRTGIDGFPNNLTIDKLIDVPAQGKPSVVTSCQECKKTNCMVGKCFHCEKALCRQCLVKHSNILKDEFNESIAKVSTRIPQLSQKISQIQQIQKGLKQNEKAVMKNIEQFCGEEARSILDSISNFRGIDIAIKPFIPTRGLSSSHTSSLVRNTSNPSGRSAKNLTAQASLLAHYYRSKGRVNRSLGREYGCLKCPQGIAVTDDDKIVVADSYNYRIKIFDSSGNPVRTFGCDGKGNAEFDRPYGVCVTISGHIVVADTWNHRIQVFDSRGIFIRAFGQDKLRRPLSVATISDELLFVADSSKSIKVFSLNGDFIRTFGESWLDSGNLLMTEMYIAVTHDNKVIVSATKQHKVKVFDQSFQFVFEIGREGESHGQLKNPRGVACDKHGNIIVADGGNHRIQVFDKDGNFTSSFGGKGLGPGQMKEPWGVAVLKNGDIVVCDTNNNRIQIF